MKPAGTRTVIQQLGRGRYGSRADRIVFEADGEGGAVKIGGSARPTPETIARAESWSREEEGDGR